ncbi:hypothetical protein BKA62DRAFT_708751 [Auriculariales sp. MPI-PUGE-AT-0066]|nr:hypothetical protein BKA62DRAFT_708751 [Auriculariales sp. MPI-PUGE-AT-0066]
MVVVGSNSKMVMSPFQSSATVATPLQQINIDRVQSTRGLKRKAGGTLNWDSSGVKRHDSADLEDNHHQPEDPLFSPASLPSTATTRSGSAGSAESKHEPVDEYAARLEEIEDDRWISKRTDDSVSCVLCARWYKIGEQYERIGLWRAHRKKCQNKANARQGLRPLTNPVEHVKHRSLIDPSDVFAQKWITHPKTQDIDAWKVHCGVCYRQIPREDWERHVDFDCTREKTYKGWIFESTDSSSSEEDEQPKKKKKGVITYAVPARKQSVESRSSPAVPSTSATPAAPAVRPKRSGSSRLTQPLRRTISKISPAVQPTKASTSIRKLKPSTSQPLVASSNARPLVRSTWNSLSGGNLVRIPTPEPQWRLKRKRAVSAESSRSASVSEPASKRTSVAAADEFETEKAVMPASRPPRDDFFLSDSSLSSAESDSEEEEKTVRSPKRAVLSRAKRAISSSDESDDNDEPIVKFRQTARPSRGRGGMNITARSRPQQRRASAEVAPPATTPQKETTPPKVTQPAPVLSVDIPTHVHTQSEPLSVSPSVLTSASADTFTETRASTPASIIADPARGPPPSIRIPKLARRNLSTHITQHLTKSPPWPAPSAPTPPESVFQHHSPVLRQSSPLVDIPKSPAVAQNQQKSDLFNIVLAEPLPLKLHHAHPETFSTSAAAVGIGLDTQEEPTTRTDMQAIMHMEVDSPLSSPSPAPMLEFSYISDDDGLLGLLQPSIQTSDEMLIDLPLQPVASQPFHTPPAAGWDLIGRMVCHTHSTRTLILRPMARSFQPLLPIEILHSLCLPILHPQRQQGRLAIESTAATTASLQRLMASDDQAGHQWESIFDTESFIQNLELKIFGARGSDWLKSRITQESPKTLPDWVPSRETWNGFVSASANPTTSRAPSPLPPSKDQLERMYAKYLNPGPPPFVDFRYEKRPECVGSLARADFSHSPAAPELAVDLDWELDEDITSLTAPMTSTLASTGITSVASSLESLALSIGTRTVVPPPRLDANLVMQSRTSRFRTTMGGAMRRQICNRAAAHSSQELVPVGSTAHSGLEEEWPPLHPAYVGLSLEQVVEARVPPFSF